MPARNRFRCQRPNFYQRVNRQHIHGAACSEDDHHEALVDWVTDTEALQTDERLKEALHWFHHVANGKWRGKPVETKIGLLPPVAAFRLKMMGVKPGIFDLRLDYPNLYGGQSFLGLLIELKSATGILLPEQRRYKRYMESIGFRCVVCRTWQAAAREIILYMNLAKIAPIFVLGHGQGTRAIQVTKPEVFLTMEVA